MKWLNKGVVAQILPHRGLVRYQHYQACSETLPNHQVESLHPALIQRGYLSIWLDAQGKTRATERLA